MLYQKDLYQIQKQLVKSSDEIYILADSSKFEKTALLKLDNMKPEYIYITDNSLQDEIVKLYKENDITDFMRKSYEYCLQNEEVIRSHIRKSEEQF